MKLAIFGTFQINGRPPIDCPIRSKQRFVTLHECTDSSCQFHSFYRDGLDRFIHRTPDFYQVLQLGSFKQGFIDFFAFLRIVI